MLLHLPAQVVELLHDVAPEVVVLVDIDEHHSPLLVDKISRLKGSGGDQASTLDKAQELLGDCRASVLVAPPVPFLAFLAAVELIFTIETLPLTRSSAVGTGSGICPPCIHH